MDKFGDSIKPFIDIVVSIFLTAHKTIAEKQDGNFTDSDIITASLEITKMCVDHMFQTVEKQSDEILKHILKMIPVEKMRRQ